MATEDTYSKMQLPQLKALIKERHIKGTSQMRKPQLIRVLVEYDMNNAPAAEKTEEKKAETENRDVQQVQEPAEEHTQRQEPEKHEKTAVFRDRQGGRKNGEERENQNHGRTNNRYNRSDNNRRPYNNNNNRRNNLRHENNNQPSAEENAGQPSYKSYEENKQESLSTEIKETAEKTRREAAREAAREQADIPRYKDAHPCKGMLEVLPDGFGFLRSNGYTTGDDDVYVSPSQIRRFRLRTGDMLTGETRKNKAEDKYGALLFMDSVNGKNPDVNARRTPFEKLTPVFPDERIRLERDGGSNAVRLVDLVSPIGKGQRGMIVSQPKAGKTTLLKDIALSVMTNNPEIHLIILLIDERPEEVTDMKETIAKANPDGTSDVEIVASTFDETPENHKRISEMVIEHARRMVEDKKDVMILLDSITRLARAYNLTVPPSGRTLSGGLDPTALYMPKRFFGAARNMREGGSLTILATALVDTGSRMDDVVFEEFKGTGNMELVLDRSLSERRVFPAIDLAKSSTRRDDLLLSKEETVAMNIVRKALSGMKSDDAIETVLNLVSHTRNNYEVCREIVRMRVL